LRDVVYVGDTPIDMETARRAGLAAVAVTWGFRSRDELERCEPDIVVDQPAEILRLFG
jgi:phosphoglycolate phosphatase